MVRFATIKWLVHVPVGSTVCDRTVEVSVQAADPWQAVRVYAELAGGASYLVTAVERLQLHGAYRCGAPQALGAVTVHHARLSGVRVDARPRILGRAIRSAPVDLSGARGAPWHEAATPERPLDPLLLATSTSTGKKHPGEPDRSQ